MKLRDKKALSFDDILMTPQHSPITSRLDPNLSLATNLTRNVKLHSPIVSTNMSTVTEEDMLVGMNSVGSVGFLHRFSTLEEQSNQIFAAKEKGMTSFVISIGVRNEDYQNLHKVFKLNPTAILIDIAHGDSKQVIDMVRYLKALTSIDIIAGNVATADGYERLIEAGADAVRVGIGGGGACTTRIVTGFGMPTLQSILDCEPVFTRYKNAGHLVPIIADGGISKSSDIVKALAAGASSVCVGSLLAGTSLSPGPTLEKVFEHKDLYAIIPIEEAEFKIEQGHKNIYKEYYGMSSQIAQDKFKGGMKTGIAAEGIHKYIPYKGSTVNVLNNLMGGIRSGLTYNGSYTIEHLQETAEYTILASGAVKESKH